MLDDPFLAADPKRLHNGFETPRRLTAEGWQVLYFTAKPEVYDELAPAFDCAVHELEQLTAMPPSTDSVEPVGCREETPPSIHTSGGLADTNIVVPGVWIDPCEQKLLYASTVNSMI